MQALLNVQEHLSPNSNIQKKIAVSLKRQIVLQKLYDKSILCWVGTYEGAAQKLVLPPPMPQK